MIHYKAIYEKIFSISNYSINSDRKQTCQLVHNYLTGDEKGVIDIGSGRGPVLIELMTKFDKAQILSCDLKKFHDYDISFRKLDLSLKVDRDAVLKEFFRFDFLTCMDVLEHIEEKYLDDTLKFFKGISRRHLIVVANHSDVWGQELHLIQESMNWWENRFLKYFSILDKKSIHSERAYVFHTRS